MNWEMGMVKVNKFEVKHALLTDEKAIITFDFINNDVLLLSVNGEIVKTNEVIDTFTAVTFTKVRDYWFSFMEKCGRSVPPHTARNTYEYEKMVAEMLFKGHKDN
ncbi:hypothetical protein CN495_07820 [Bacillus thuringiensis]|uniref:Uncharacterized protein n=1 Tax=Bacillus thuringiensis TaxID=1428 RepID=A0ABD6SKR3_BACTU|nr:hypothetical protein [Bacillus thuringiensis]PER55652.1 hypothetical protein CN495_07820 [Bacillus thuringiensis]